MKEGDDMVTTICYGKEETWLSRQMAIDTFTEAMNATEGSEHDRYAKIVADLEAGEEVATDEFPNERPIMSEHHKYVLMLNWISVHTNDWYDLIAALCDCGFSRREVEQMAAEEGWGDGVEEEEDEIKEVIEKFSKYGWW